MNKKFYFWLKIILLIIIFIILCIFVRKLQAAEPHAVWNPSQGATGYILYYTDGSVEYNMVTGDAYVRLSDLDMTPCKEYQLTVSAFNQSGESGRSNEVIWKMPCWTPPADQKPLHITIPSGVTITITAE